MACRLFLGLFIILLTMLITFKAYLRILEKILFKNFSSQVSIFFSYSKEFFHFRTLKEK